MTPISPDDRDDWREHYPHGPRLLDEDYHGVVTARVVVRVFVAGFVMFALWGVLLWWRSGGAS